MSRCIIWNRKSDVLLGNFVATLFVENARTTLEIPLAI
jgi:hypothetical protein